MMIRPVLDGSYDDLWRTGVQAYGVQAYKFCCNVKMSLQSLALVHLSPHLTKHDPNGHQSIR